MGSVLRLAQPEQKLQRSINHRQCFDYDMTYRQTSHVENGMTVCAPNQF